MNNLIKVFSILCCLHIFAIQSLTGQCQQFVVGVTSIVCDNNGTPLDPADDLFTVTITIANGLNPDNTWSSSDGLYTNEPYPATEILEYGTFLISDGDVVVTFTDDQDGCIEEVLFEAPEPCSSEPLECPTWNDCVSLVSSDGCTHTFVINIEGDGQFTDSNDPFPVNFINWTFTVTGNGSVASGMFIDPNGYYEQNGVSLSASGNSVNLNYFDTQNDLEGFQLTGDIVEFTVEAQDVPSCFTVTRNTSNVIGAQDNNGLVICEDEDDCAPIEVCSEGETISGIVEAYTGVGANCPDTENLGIEGVEITVTSANGSCNAITGNDGTYECTLCEGGPYEICVETTCDEPCGLTSYDIILLRKIILGVTEWPPYINIIADVNNSGGFSTLDLVHLQREILELDTDFIENWCRFVPTFDLNGPNSNDIELDGCSIANGPNSPFGATDFVRFMVGDINGSCSDCTHGDGMGDIPIVADDGPGVLKIKSPKNGKIHALALQFKLSSDTKINTLESSLSDFMYNVIGDELHIIWSDPSDDNVGYYNDGSENLLEIYFEGETPTITNDENMILTSEGDVLNIVERSGPKGREKVDEDIQLLKVEHYQPFELVGNANVATIEVYSISGQMVERQVVDIHTEEFVKLQKEYDLGVYIIRVYNEYNDVSRKIVWNRE